MPAAVVSILLLVINIHASLAEDLENLPSFDPSTPQNLTIYQGETARLMCSVFNLQGKKITWQIRGSQYPLTVGTFSFLSDDRVEVEHDDDAEWNLLIHRTGRSDSGIYQCRVPTQTMLLVREVHLTVQDRPPQSTPAVSLGELSIIYAEKGKELTLQCNATARQVPPDTVKIIPPEVEWFKDGNKIDSHRANNILITNQVKERLMISTLIIEKTDMDDAGIYVCRTTDKTNAEVAVRILNVDKDNKKRGTATGTGALTGGHQSSDNRSSSLAITEHTLALAVIIMLILT